MNIGTKVLGNISQPTAIHHFGRTRSMLILAFSCAKAGFWLSGKNATRAEIFNKHQTLTVMCVYSTNGTKSVVRKQKKEAKLAKVTLSPRRGK
jgi:hypothetical protein